MGSLHTYAMSVRWTGNRGEGTRGYRGYDRAHEVSAPGKPVILGSSDAQFRGDASRWNPEELLVAALSQCHLLWYLHLAAEAGVVVTGYRDDPVGTMQLDADGSGQFTEVVLRPAVCVRDPEMRAPAQELHHPASARCFIARSVAFPVRHQATATVEGLS